MGMETESMQEELGYDATVGELVYRERTASYPLPLRAKDRETLFVQWCRVNADALREMDEHAVAMQARGRRVSAKWLVEWERYEGEAKLRGIPFTDQHGSTHVYAINNSDTPLIARWLRERHPSMRIETRRSMFDPRGCIR